MNMASRRQFVVGIVTASTAGIAGCSGGNGSSESGPEESGTAVSDTIHNLDVEAEETIRVEIENDEGVGTIVSVTDPSDESVAESTVETDSTITHTATEGGVYRVLISPDGSASYEIFVE